MSRRPRPIPVVLSAVALAAIAAGCSSGGGSSSKASSPAPPPATSSPPASSSPMSPTAASATVNAASATVSGKSETVLVAKDGKTLYYFTPDNAAGKATCSGGCASIWPPLTGTPAAGSGVTGMLTMVMGANGTQVSYNGHPLYEYSGDSAPGQAHGEGIMNEWHAATPNLMAASSTPAPSTGGSTGGSSGGGNY